VKEMYVYNWIMVIPLVLGGLLSWLAFPLGFLLAEFEFVALLFSAA
jgi:hypothetical protein